MNDRAPIRDRTLVLRILVPRLEERLREKMRDLEEAAASAPGTSKAESYLDLDGVSCEPTAAWNRTLWNFHCDGMLYPAQLVNLPCPVEVHKTLDRASYFKAADVAQMLVVFEDKTALDQAQEKPSEGFPSYYHSGLTPPMKRVVERRLERRFTSRDRKAVPPSRTAVQDVEEQLLELMEKLQKDEKWTGKRSSKLPVLTSATKDLEEVDEEVVDYEPWMDDGGNQPLGIEFDAEDHLSAKVHPEIWLPPDTIRAIKEETKAAEEAALAAAAAAAAAAAEKPTTKKKKSKKKAAAAAAAAAAEADKGPQPKKGIASKKNKAVVDELTQAAMTMTDDLMADVLGDDDFFAGFDMDFDMDGNV